MRKIELAFANALSEDVTKLVVCWQIKLQNGVILGFTEHIEDIAVNDLVYLASPSFKATAISSGIDLKPDLLELQVTLDQSVITEEDLHKGVYNEAEVLVFLIDYTSPKSGMIHLQKGFIGEITVGSGYFIAEIQGITQKLSAIMGWIFSNKCKAAFCDKRCGLNAAKFTVKGSVSEVINATEIFDRDRKEKDGVFNNGVLKFFTGRNLGSVMTIRGFKNSIISFYKPPPMKVYPGDEYEITEGCDKSFDTCSTRFNNAINFRGEP